MPISRLPTKHYTAYIDEAGDEGLGKLAAGPIGGQSRWLIIGACVVTRENDLLMPLWRDKILARFPKKQTRDLHFRNLKHEQKVVACQELADKPLHACAVLSHKVTLLGTKWEAIFKRKGYLYNYLIRWLLERVTEFCARQAAPNPCALKVVFSRRANTDYEAMRDYMILMRDGNEAIKPVRSINWSVLDVDNIAVENHSRWAGLQIADVITSATFSGFEPNVYGNYEPGYLRILKPRLMRSRFRNSLDCGLTPVPGWNRCGADALQAALIDEIGIDR